MEFVELMFIKMQKEWYNFQEEICNYFKSLGFEAETNKKIYGVRTSHNIDIYVKTKFMGQDLIWIIEAKKWTAKINKHQVLGLRSIIEDIGADKGFIVSENGFQKGAIEASKNTNIRLLQFNELVNISKEFIENDQFDLFLDRISNIEKRYISHSKYRRIEYNLRDHYSNIIYNYSIFWVLTKAIDAIELAKLKKYPIDLNTSLLEKHGSQTANNFQQLVNWLNLNLNIVEKKLFEGEKKMYLDGNYKPYYKTHLEQ